jgi:hypothetical protein
MTFSAVAMELWRKPLVAVTTRTFFGAAAERVIAASRQLDTRETVFMRE